MRYACLLGLGSIHLGPWHQHPPNPISLPVSFPCSVLEAEAKRACEWLRATGFPQYVQLFEGKATQLFTLPRYILPLALSFLSVKWGKSDSLSNYTQAVSPGLAPIFF